MADDAVRAVPAVRRGRGRGMVARLALAAAERLAVDPGTRGGARCARAVSRDRRRSMAAARRTWRPDGGMVERAAPWRMRARCAGGLRAPHVATHTPRAARSASAARGDQAI